MINLAWILPSLIAGFFWLFKDVDPVFAWIGNFFIVLGCVAYAGLFLAYLWPKGDQ
jgi:hypothetical protein